MVDLEATCWLGQPPEGQVSEIIEIGWALIENELIVDRGTQLVLPSNSTVSEFCTQLTSITQEMLNEEGVPLVDAVALIKADLDVDDLIRLPWASWGDYDANMLARSGVKMGRHLNLSSMFVYLFNKSKSFGLAKACANLGVPWEGTAHRGGDDAYMAALIALKTRSLMLPEIARQVETLSATLRRMTP